MKEEEMEELKWRVVYSNDVGPDDDGFWEWWEVTDGKRTFKSDSEEDAEWLCAVLNKQGA
jgi:hypothetical protein